MTDEELKEKCFLISKQGLSLVTLHDKMIVYITFLDQENLSRYKALIYEEEEFVKGINSLNSLEGDEKWNLFKKLSGNPQSREILRRMLTRNGRTENLEAKIDVFLEACERAKLKVKKYCAE